MHQAVFDSYQLNMSVWSPYGLYRKYNIKSVILASTIHSAGKSEDILTSPVLLA